MNLLSLAVLLICWGYGFSFPSHWLPATGCKRGLKVLKWLRVLTRGKTASSTDRLDKVLRVLRVLRFFESTKIGLDLRFKVYLLTANC